MSTTSITLRHKLAAAGTALFAAVALPLGAGTAHAATPEEDLLACDSAAVASYRTAFDNGTDYDLSAAVDDCINAFLRATAAASPTSTADDAVTDGSVNTGILGTVDGVTDTIVDAG